MSKLARACAAVAAVATSLAGGIAAAQIQGGIAGKAAPPSIALGIPVAKVTSAISQRSSSSSTSGSGSSLSFTSGQPALRYQPIDLPTAKDPVRREAVRDGAKEAHVSARGAAATGTPSTTSATGEFAPAPGVLRANMPPVTFADAQRVLQARVLPANLNQGVSAVPAIKTGKTSTLARMKIAGDAAASGPASIAELARALRNHPDLIYQYVRNNVEYYPTFGIQKGALGAVLDNQATAHDQAALMVELLRASGLEANYVRGIAKLSAAQLAEWWGVSTANACGVLSLLGQAQIPVYEINATTAGSCPGTVAALTDVSIEHIWVKTRINGSWYVFDPSYKPHTFKTGIDLAGTSTTGYDAATHLSSAQSGATVSTDYVQNLNRTNIRNNLNTYATKLASYLRTNKPAGTLDDVLGGKTIVPFYGALRQTALPYQNTAWGSEELAELPGYMKPTLRVQYQGIDQTYTSDAIYGRRLTGDLSWIDGGTTPAHPGGASYQVAWTLPMDMLNAKRHNLLEGGGGGGNGAAGGSGGPTYSRGGVGTNYIVTPGGTVFPVPRGAVGPTPTTNGVGVPNGTAFTGGSGGSNGQVSTMRIMDPTRAGGGNPGYPNGYIKYENNASPRPQSVDPYTGRVLPRSEQHYPID
jgi:transglutaminase-like putative cysteine protease